MGGSESFHSVANLSSSDFRIQGSFGAVFDYLVGLSFSILTKFLAVIVYSPVFIVPGLVVGLLGYWIGRVYMYAQLPVKREMSNAKSPVYSHFGAAMAGLTTIRAYGVEEAFKAESKRRIDAYTRPARTNWNLNRWVPTPSPYLLFSHMLSLRRWVCMRIDTLGGMFTASLAAYLVYWRGEGNPRCLLRDASDATPCLSEIVAADASTAGFSLSMALGFTSLLLIWVRILNRFEVLGALFAEMYTIETISICRVLGNNLERIKGYVDIEEEPKSTEAGKPPAYWPSSGSLRVEGLSARYSVDGAEVLQGLSFEIKSGERVGVGKHY